MWKGGLAIDSRPLHRRRHRRGLPVAAVGEFEDEVEKLKNGLERGGDIRQSGGGKDVVDGTHVVLVDDALADQQRLGPRAGVEFDGEVDELKENNRAECSDAEQDQPGEMKY